MLVPTSEDARNLAGVASGRAEIDLLGPLTQVAEMYRALDQERLDLVAVEARAISLSELDRLRTAVRSRGLHLTVFESEDRLESTLARLIRGARRRRTSAPRRAPPRVVAVACSTGGPDALGELIPRLPPSFGPTVLIAQHMPPNFTPILARRLAERAQLPIREAQDGDALASGLVLIAPGDHHLEIREDGCSVRLHRGPPENSCRPAADVLFRSVAKTMGPKALGVVLTGMGRDGLAGARLMRERGAEIFVQDEDSSVVWGMPGLIAREGLATQIATLPEIARYLVERAPPAATLRAGGGS
ncbi:MAG: CheB methylesterase domain-containing protein [Myxococcota bacterium]